MKETIYTEIICKGFCKYYKEGSEELHCNGYVFLRDNFTLRELKTMIEMLRLKRDIKYKIPERDKGLTSLLCRKCDFFVEGCDYADNQSGPPCGGFLIVNLFAEHLFQP